MVMPRLHAQPSAQWEPWKLAANNSRNCEETAQGSGQGTVERTAPQDAVEPNPRKVQRR